MLLLLLLAVLLVSLIAPTDNRVVAGTGEKKGLARPYAFIPLEGPNFLCHLLAGNSLASIGVMPGLGRCREHWVVYIHKVKYHGLVLAWCRS